MAPSAARESAKGSRYNPPPVMYSQTNSFMGIQSGQLLEIIPVIDLLNQQVVHAKRGEREHYRPIRSSLCDSCAPLDIVKAMRELYPFGQLYIADLDAIQQRGGHHDAIAHLRQAYPELRIWLDAGIRNITDLAAWDSLDVDWVIGSESLADMPTYLSLKETLGQRMLLSLDYGQEGFRGPSELLQHSHLWPERVIAMTLARVGSGEGPDIAKLTEIINLRPTGRHYAAGGVRHRADLEILANAGVTGALVASAIHDGSLFDKPA